MILGAQTFHHTQRKIPVKANCGHPRVSNRMGEVIEGECSCQPIFDEKMMLLEEGMKVGGAKRRRFMLANCLIIK